MSNTQDMMTSIVADISPYQGDIFSCVVIDGSNAIHVTREEFSFKRLINTIHEVEKLGWKTLTCMKVGTYNQAIKSKSNLTDDEKKRLKEMRDMGKFSLIEQDEELKIIDDTEMSKRDYFKKFTPGIEPEKWKKWNSALLSSNYDKGKDDKMIILTAKNKDGWILSNDRYRAESKEMEKEKNHELLAELKKRWVKLDFFDDENPVFNLPHNMASQFDTKIIESQKLVEEIVFESNNVSVIMEINGQSLPNAIDLPLRQPIGRLDFNVPDHEKMEVSRSHFRLDNKGNDYWITDLNSKNGVYLDDMKIPPKFAQKINTDSVIRIGKMNLSLSK